MHERSLVKSLLSQVNELCARESTDSFRLATVAEIQVEMGPLSGVDAVLLQGAFEELAPNSNAKNARLSINKVPLVATCIRCEIKTEIKDFVFRCPKCRGSVEIVSGDGFFLIGVTFLQQEPV